MANYLIHATEQIYQGYHGIEDYAVYYDISETEANETGREMSLAVMESYSAVMDSLESEVEDAAEEEGIAYETIDENEVDEWKADTLTELMESNTEWTIYRLRDNLTDDEKDVIKATRDWELIVEKFGVKE